MPNLSDFLKCEKVRCVKTGFNTGLTLGKEYEILGVTKDEVCILNDNGLNWCYKFKRFEPVLETAIPATNALDDTPMGTRTEFEVGNRVYYQADEKIFVIDGVSDFGDVKIKDWQENYHNPKYFCHATPENYEMLCKLYPHIEFEAPPKELIGSDLCRAMLDKGWKYVLCYVDDYSEKVEDLFFRAITRYDNDWFYCEQDGRWAYAVPFDPKTGNVLTSEVLDD